MQKIMRSMGDLVEKYRQEVSAKYQAEISQELERMRAEGQYPFEGKWRTLEEITKLQKLMRQKDRAIFGDLIVLFLLMFFFLGLITLLLFSL